MIEYIGHAIGLPMALIVIVSLIRDLSLDDNDRKW